MPLSVAERNALLDDFATRALFVSLHSSDPGDTGAAEIAGGAPAYARQAATWGVAAAASLDLTNSPAFDVPTTTVAYVGFWTLAVGGTFRGGVQVTPEVFAAQGVYTLVDFDLGAT